LYPLAIGCRWRIDTEADTIENDVQNEGASFQRFIQSAMKCSNQPRGTITESHLKGVASLGSLHATARELFHDGGGIARFCHSRSLFSQSARDRGPLDKLVKLLIVQAVKYFFILERWQTANARAEAFFRLSFGIARIWETSTAFYAADTARLGSRQHVQVCFCDAVKRTTGCHGFSLLHHLSSFLARLC
jgi:hypothetical protein